MRKLKQNKNNKFCGECAKIIWNTKFENLDSKGLPIHGMCPITNTNRILTETACDFFIQQTNDSQNFYKLSQWDLKNGYEKK